MKKWIAILYSLLFFLPPAHSREMAFNPDPGLSIIIPENNKAREEFRDVIFSSVSLARQRNNTVIKQREDMVPVLFGLKEDADCYYLLFLNQDNGLLHPLAYKGNLSIKKQKDSGEFLYFTILLRNEKDSYIRITPFGDRSRMDVCLFGSLLYRNVSLALPFTKLLTASFTKIKELTAGIVDWNLVLFRHHTQEDALLADAAEKIRNALPLLKDADDGSYNSLGKLVSISDESSLGAEGGLNCSGFAKWIIDGFYYTSRGSLLEISILKQRLLQFRGTRWSRRYEEARDPYFGLDWTRNLAAALYEAEQGKAAPGFEMFDVRDLPFFRYVEDVGYQVEDIKLLLYLLTLEKPGCLYLGSVNGQWGKEPVLRQHYHIVALLPCFLKDGSFQITVFERNRETSTESLVKHYNRDNIHLVRINTRLEFSGGYMAGLAHNN